MEAIGAPGREVRGDVVEFAEETGEGDVSVVVEVGGAEDEDCMLRWVLGWKWVEGRSWRGKWDMFTLLIARRISWKMWSGTGLLRSTPLTSAPKVGCSGLTRICSYVSSVA
jgi:hypothetical protein